MGWGISLIRLLYTLWCLCSISQGLLLLQDASGSKRWRINADATSRNSLSRAFRLPEFGNGAGTAQLRHPSVLRDAVVVTAGKAPITVDLTLTAINIYLLLLLLLSCFEKEAEIDTGHGYVRRMSRWRLRPIGYVDYIPSCFKNNPQLRSTWLFVLFFFP